MPSFQFANCEITRGRLIPKCEKLIMCETMQHPMPYAIWGWFMKLGVPFFWHLTTTYHFSDHSVAGLIILNCRILSFVVVFSLFGVNFGYRHWWLQRTRSNISVQNTRWFCPPMSLSFLLRTVLWTESSAWPYLNGSKLRSWNQSNRCGRFSCVPEKWWREGPSLNHKWHQKWMHWI